MNDPLAVIVAGIGAAIVTGLVSIALSLISYRAANRQLRNQLADNASNRRHQILLSIITKRQQAIEDIWKLLFILERQGELNEKELDVYIRSLMWLPSNLRDMCLGVLNDKSAKLKLDMRLLREALIKAANSIEYES
jgi:hypothetical protein